jgi:hypothetical protein
MSAALLDDSLYSNRIGSGGAKQAPRRQLKVNNASAKRSQLSSASPHTSATQLIDVKRSGPASFDGEPIQPLAKASELKETAPPPPASQYYRSDASRRVDASYRGMRVAGESSRVHNKTHEYMGKIGRVIERTEVNPHTGARVDYYRQLPPEANKDYRLPKETMGHVNRRLVAIQGYDHTKPKPQRRERLADAPQPDGVFDDAQHYMRRMGEMQERVMRDLNLNQNGQRPTWMRDHKRAFGYKGYQNMSRFVPDVPATMRADTQPVQPTKDQTFNPNPKIEAAARGIHSNNASKPHVEKVDWRGHRITSVSAPPIIGEISETKRNDTHKFDPERLQTSTLVGAGAAIDDSITKSVFASIIERNGHKLNGSGGSVPSGLGVKDAGVYSGNQVRSMHDHVDSKREGEKGAQMMLPSHTSQTANMPPIIPTSQQHNDTKRTNHPTGLHESFGIVSKGEMPPQVSKALNHNMPYRVNAVGGISTGHSSGNQNAVANHNISRFLEGLTKREHERVDGKEHFTLAEASSVGHANIQNSVYTETGRTTDIYTLAEGELARSHKTGAPRSATEVSKEFTGGAKKLEGQVATEYQGPAAAAEQAAVVFGEQTKHNYTGKRADTGNVSTTGFMHTGGEGAADAGRTYVNMGAYDKRTDSTRVNALRGGNRVPTGVGNV